MCLFKPVNGFGQRSPFFSCQLRGPSGKIVSVGTKLNSKRLANQIESIWRKAADAGERGHLTAERAKALVAECAEIARGPSLLQSEKFIDSCLRQSTGSGLNIPSVENYFQSWLQAKAESGRNSEGTLNRYRPILNRFLSHLTGARRRARLDAVNPLDCAGFLRAERERVSAASTNQAIRVLRIVFNSARRQGLITSNPADAVDLLHESHDTRLPFSIDQVRAILEVADEEWKGMVLGGFYAGIRLGDLSRLTWGNIDLEAQTVTFRPQKTARRKPTDTVIDLHRDLVAYLRSLQPGTPAAPLFPRLSKRSTSRATGLSEEFRKLMEDAGIISSLGRGSDVRRFRQLSFHSLRHAYITQLSRVGVPIEIRRELAGHSSDAVSLGYTHVSRSLTTAAIDALPSV